MLKKISLRRIILAAVSLISISDVAAQNDTWIPTGSGSKEYPYEISSLFDLQQYAHKIEKIENFSTDKYFVLTADISMQDVEIIDAEGNLVADTAALKKWEPIGTEWYGKSFAGHFDGQGHTISGIYVDAKHHNSDYAGLFGHLKGTVKNLIITNSFFCGGSNIGAFAGEMAGDDAVIENCTSYATVSGEKASTMQIGGIFGYTYYGTVKKCRNYGKIILEAEANEWGEIWNCSAGGIGGSGGSVSECENFGAVVSRSWGGIGGIVGSPRYVSACINYGIVEDFHGNNIGGIGASAGYVWNCENHGQVISHAKSAKIGGICGTIGHGGARIGGCTNYIDLQSSESGVWLGGICGYGDISDYTTTYITECSNMGSVTTTDETSHCAGIVPYLYHVDVNLSKNFGDVSCESDAGGVVSLAMAHGNIRGSENHGRVEGKGYVGGIAGQSAQSIHGCVNFGDVTLKTGSRIGGIIGYMSSSSSSAIDCANLGNLVTFDSSMIGGIVGNSSSYGAVRCCYNSGDIVSHGDSWMGGIAGYMANSIEDCYNKGNIINYGSGSCLAGIAGWSNSTIKNVFTAGFIYCLGENETAGHIVSGTYTTINGFARRTNVYYSAKIIGEPAKYTNTDSYYTYIPIAEEDLAGITDILNKDREYGDVSGWMPGYFHPLLKRYYATEGSDYDAPEYNYDVTTLSDDTCRIDLGRPFDNTFFTTDKEDNSRLCLNTIYDNSKLKRMWVVDGKDFEMPGELDVEQSVMCVNDVRGFSAMIFPWEMNRQGLPEGVESYEFSENDGTSVKFVSSDMIPAGKAILLEFPDTVRFLMANLNNSHISAPVAVTGVFEGSFSEHISTPTQYFLNAADSAFVKYAEPVTVKAFEAYLNVEAGVNDELIINLNGSAFIESVALDTKTLLLRRTGELEIKVTGNEALGEILVYDTKGNIVTKCDIDSSNAVLAMPARGIYILKVGGRVMKVSI